MKKPRELQSWLKNLNLQNNKQPLENLRLCSEHYSEECFTRENGTVKLREGSIPTLFHAPKHQKKCIYCNVPKTNKGDRIFHKFPLKNSVQLQKWLSRIPLQNFFPTKDDILCSDHFKPDCFRRVDNNKLRLRALAVPTVFKPELPTKINVLSSKVEATAAASFEKSESAADMETTVDSETAVYIETDADMDTTIDVDSTRDMVPVPIILSTSTDRPQKRRPNTPVSIYSMRHDHHYEASPRSYKRKLTSALSTIKKLSKECKLNKQRVKRLTTKISSLKDIVRTLRESISVSESGLACLESMADSDVSEFLRRYARNANKSKKTGSKIFKRRGKLVAGISREKYPPAIRTFAMTLHFYSPKAYRYVRQKFCNALPDPSTLRLWYSTVNCEPGFTSESFDALKEKVSEEKKVGRQVIVTLMLDEIGIKKGIQYIRDGKLRGYVNVGSGIETCDDIPLAKEALVFMAVALDGRWKIPLGYFLVNGIDSSTNASLIQNCLQRLDEIGVEVSSLTLDGPSQHFATLRKLGATFDLIDPQPYFLHPSNKKKVHVILDACHMLKLFRNCLGDQKELRDNEGQKIEWRFITALAYLQEKEGLRAGNLLKIAHIQYWKMKMKVALAAQTLSSSVADAIEFCARVLGLPEFQGSEGTVRFIRCIDRLFDFLNSRNPFGKGYKSPLRRTNEFIWRPQILADIEYLKGITNVEGKEMWKTKRYVPFVGMITAAMSVIGIYDTYVKPEGSQMKYLLTYKCSQDHLELFFCAIRRCGGWCPNPTCAQFISAYKRLLVRHEIIATNGNAEAMDSTSILTVSSGAGRKKPIDRYDPAVYSAMDNIRFCKNGLDEEIGHWKKYIPRYTEICVSWIFSLCSILALSVYRDSI
ncbi:uncharacterized protein [Temnothorax longispinosus]|uniref:uncharacterized protein n=1 Tax=Temnothorax longispinosus TaxID=300112 RepID=UPI003A9964A4